MVESELTIHNRMLATIADNHDKEEGSFIYDATKPSAIEVTMLQMQIEKVEGKLDIMNLTGDDLTRFVYDRTGIKRKNATYASGEIKLIGSAGTKIKREDIVSTSTNILFNFSEDSVIGESGIALLEIICQSSGEIGNTKINTITLLPLSIDGVISITNPTAFSNGYNDESDHELRRRYFDKLQRPGKAGNKYHFEEWAKSIDGVGDARCVPRYNGPLSVQVVIIDSNGLPASIDLINITRSYIEAEMPFGVEDLSVISAIAVPIDLSLSLSLLEGANADEIIQSLKMSLINYLKELAFKSNIVSYAKIGAFIIATEGVLDYTNLVLNGAKANIEILANQVAILGEVQNEPHVRLSQE